MLNGSISLSQLLAIDGSSDGSSVWCLHTQLNRKSSLITGYCSFNRLQLVCITGLQILMITILTFQVNTTMRRLGK